MMWKAIAKWGLLLGVLAVTWLFVMGFTGWVLHPTWANLFFLVILVDVVIVVLALRSTRAVQGYGRQVATGALVGVVGGLVVIAGSLLFTTVLFPGYFEDLAAMQQEVLTARGVAEEQVAAITERTRQGTPLAQALSGFVGTLFTSLLTALIAGIWLRRRDAERVVDERWGG